MSNQESNDLPKKADAELLAEMNSRREKSSSRSRTLRFAVTLCFLAAGIILIIGDCYWLAFVTLGLALILGVLSVDAQQHLCEVRARPWRSLAPRLPEAIVEGTNLTEASESKP